MTWTYPGNVTGIADMFIYVSNETNQIFPLLTVISIFIISLISALLAQIQPDKAFIFSSTLTFSLSSILWVAGFVPGKILVAVLSILIFSFIYGYVSDK